MRSCLGQQSRRLHAGPFEIAETFHARGLTLPRHAHARACLHFVLAGAYQESTARGAEQLEAGAVLYKPAGETHWNRFEATTSRTLRIELEPSATARVPLEPCTTRDPHLATLARGLELELRRPDELTPLAAEGLCLSLVAGLARTRASGPRCAGRARHALARDAARLLQERHEQSLSFQDLASELGVDRSHLARSFRELHGTSMGQYLRRLRVGRACRALRDTSAPLAAVALSAGFSDQSHLARAFRRLLGTSPAAYRRAHR